MTRLGFLLGDVRPGTASPPMEDRREKRVRRKDRFIYLNTEDMNRVIC